MNPQETFVTRLRRYRQRNEVTLEEIAAEWRIRPDLLEAFERNDLSAWPRGVYARTWIRGYAIIVGLDPDDTVDEFCRLFPHGDRRVRGTMREMAAIVELPSEYRDEFTHEGRRHDDPVPVPAPVPAGVARVLGAVRGVWTRCAESGLLAAWRAGRSPRPL